MGAAIGDVDGNRLADSALTSPGGRGPNSKFTKAGELHVFHDRSGGSGEFLTASACK